jgi:hypothetical protein
MKELERTTKCPECGLYSFFWNDSLTMCERCATAAAMASTNYTADSSVADADSPVTAPTPSPTLNGASDNRTAPHCNCHDCQRGRCNYCPDCGIDKASQSEHVLSTDCWCEPGVIKVRPELRDDRPFIVYLSGPMHGSKQQPDDREMAADVAELYSAWLWNHGYAVFSPQLNTTHMFYFGATGGENSAPYLAFDMAFISEMANAVFALPGWEHSDGARLEVELAELKGIPIWTTLQQVLDWEDS